MDLDDFGCIFTFVRLSIFFLRSRLVCGIFDEWYVGWLVEKFTDVDGGLIERFTYVNDWLVERFTYVKKWHAKKTCPFIERKIECVPKRPTYSLKFVK